MYNVDRFHRQGGDQHYGDNTMTDTQKQELARKLGVDVNAVNSMLHTLAYRKAYNKREDVVARRKEYTAVRNARISQLNKILKGGE